MATATASLPISRRSGNFSSFVVAAATKLFQGVFAALDGSNRLVAATDAAARRVIGLMAEEADNSAGAAGDIEGKVEHGLFLVNNGANALTNAHIGKPAFIEDDNTVGSSPGTNAVVAGIVHEVTSQGVWLWVGVPHVGQVVAPESVTLTSTNGTAAAASANLANLAAEAEKIGDDVRAIYTALKNQGLLK